MIKSNLCDYIDADIHFKATITVQNTAAAVTPVNNTNKKAIFQNMTEINNTQVDDA